MVKYDSTPFVGKHLYQFVHSRTSQLLCSDIWDRKSGNTEPGKNIQVIFWAPWKENTFFPFKIGLLLNSLSIDNYFEVLICKKESSNVTNIVKKYVE